MLILHLKIIPKQMQKISLIVTLLLFFVSIQQGLAKPIDSAKVIVALNCGSKSEQVSTSEGSFKYVPDEKFVKGSSVDVDYHNDAAASQTEIKFALDKQLYMYERHTYQEMVYQLPVRRGKNTIIMKFAQMYFKTKGQRVFNIKIGSKIVVQNFDVIEKSGSKYAAHEQFIEVDVRADGVYHNGAKINQGLENNKLKLSFVKGKADNPIVQGIIVYHDSIENSPKQQFTLLKSKWNSQQEMLKAKKQEKELKELIQIQKIKERTIMRNDQLVVDEIQQNKKTSADTGDRFGIIRSLLMGPVGIVFWAIVFGYAMIYAHNNVFRMQRTIKLSKNQ